jgi:hypothetical protein
MPVTNPKVAVQVDEASLFDLVPWEAARRGIPPVALWLKVIDALEGDAFPWRSTERPPSLSFLDDAPLIEVEVDERWLPARESWASRFAVARFHAELGRVPISFGCGWFKDIVVNASTFGEWVDQNVPRSGPGTDHPHAQQRRPARGRARHAIQVLYGGKQPLKSAAKVTVDVNQWLGNSGGHRVSEDTVARVLAEDWPRS